MQSQRYQRTFPVRGKVVQSYESIDSLTCDCEWFFQLNYQSRILMRFTVYRRHNVRSVCVSHVQYRVLYVLRATLKYALITSNRQS